MDKEKEIEDMKNTLVNYAMKHDLCFSFEAYRTYAKTLVEAGYGHISTALSEYLHSNVKAAAMIDSIVIIKQREAVKEFAEKLLRWLIEGDGDEEDGFTRGYNCAVRAFRERIKEFYGEEKKQ